MSVHPAGDGAAWVTDIDVDQPHGLDYRAWNHLALAVQNRMQKGHQAFGDSTAGGEHIPGGAGVLGMEITDAGGDVTAVVVGDGTYQGRGLVWAYDGSKDARLWCATATAEATTTGDWTVLKMNPAKQWDSTATVDWSCGHLFDASVDFTTAKFHGSVCVLGALNCGSDVNIAEHLYCGSDCDVTGAFACGSGAFIKHDISTDGGLVVDGTAVFASNVDISGALDVSGALNVGSAAVSIFGACTSQSSLGNDISIGAYKVGTDGFLYVEPLNLDNGEHVYVFVGSANPPTTKLGQSEADTNYDVGIYLSVAKDEYFEITGSANSVNAAVWRPIGTGSCVSQ